MSIYNKFKSTSVYGTFLNLDNTTSNIQANGYFQRNLTINNDLYLGNEITQTIVNNELDEFGNIKVDEFGNNITFNTYNYIDTGGNINIKLQNKLYTITPNDLVKLKQDLSNTKYIDDKFLEFTNGASPAYDTLKEISDYILNNSQDVQSILSNLSTKANIDSVNQINNDISNINNNFFNFSTLTYTDNKIFNIENSLNSINSKFDLYYNKSFIDSNFYNNIVINGTINNINNNLSNLSNILTNNYYDKSNIEIIKSSLNSNINNISLNLSNNYYTSSNVDMTINNLQNQIISINGNLSNFYTKDEVSNIYATKLTTNNISIVVANLSNNLMNNYYTSSNIDMTINNLKNQIISVNGNLFNYYTKDEVSNIYANKTTTNNISNLVANLSNNLTNNYYTSSQTDSKYFINSLASNLISGTLNFNNLCKVYNKNNFLKLITNTSQDITNLFNDSSNFGLAIGWNYIPNSGKTSFFNCGQASTGGFLFYCQSVYNYNLPIPNPTLIMDMGFNYISCNQPLYTNDLHINYSLITNNGIISNQQLGYLKNLTSDVQNQITTLQTNFSNVQTRLTTDETNITNNTNDITNIKTRLTTNENYTLINTNDITNIKTRLNTDETNITTNANDISNIKTRLTTDEANINLKAGLTTNNIFTGTNTFNNTLNTPSFSVYQTNYSFINDVNVDDTTPIFINFSLESNFKGYIYINVPISAFVRGTVYYNATGSNTGLTSNTENFNIKINDCACFLINNGIYKSIKDYVVIDDNTLNISFNNGQSGTRYNYDLSNFLSMVKISFYLENNSSTTQSYSISFKPVYARNFSSSLYTAAITLYISRTIANYTTTQVNSKFLTYKTIDVETWANFCPLNTNTECTFYGKVNFSSNSNFNSHVKFNSTVNYFSESSFYQVPYYYDIPLVCGVYLINSGGVWIPCFKSISDFGNSAIDIPTKSCDGGSVIVSTDNSGINIITEDKDIAFALYPNFGVIGFQDPGMTGNKVINVFNESSTLKIYKTVNYNNKLSSIKVFYGKNIL